MLTTDSFPLLAAAAFVGMFNVNGRDRGAIPIIEQAILPRDRERRRSHACLRLVQRAARCGLRAVADCWRRCPRCSSSRMGLDARRRDARIARRSSAGSTSRPRRSTAHPAPGGRRGIRRARASLARKPPHRHEDLAALPRRRIRRRLRGLGAARVLLRGAIRPARGAGRRALRRGTRPLGLLASGGRVALQAHRPASTR